MGQVQSGGTDFGDTDDAQALDRRFHGLNERQDQLVESHQTEAQAGGAREREPLAHLVEGQQRVGPAVAWSEDVPGAEDGGIETAFLDHLFAFGADGDVVLHKGSRVGDAEIDEMMDAEFGASVDSLAGRDQVNGAKRSGFRQRRMRDAD